MAPPPVAGAKWVMLMLPDTESGDVACERARILKGGATLWSLRQNAHGRRGLQKGSSVPTREGVASCRPIESMSKVVSPLITESGNVTTIWSSRVLSLESAESTSWNASFWLSLG